MSIAENVARVRDRIAATARRAGRNPMEIALMAVTKTHPPERIREAYAAGLRLFGENRVQEFASKADKLRDLEAAEWHMMPSAIQQGSKRGRVVYRSRLDRFLETRRKIECVSAKARQEIGGFD